MSVTTFEAAFVVCICNEGYRAALELHKIYRTVPDKDAEANGEIRVVDESGEDYVYPETYFTAIQRSVELAKSLRGAS